MPDKFDTYFNWVILCLAVASFSWTISRSKLFKSFRSWISKRSYRLGELFSCPYCLIHWVAIFVCLFPKQLAVDVAQGYGWIIDFVIRVFATTTLASMISGYAIRIPLGFGNGKDEDIEHLEGALSDAKSTIVELVNQIKDQKTVEKSVVSQS